MSQSPTTLPNNFRRRLPRALGVLFAYWAFLFVLTHIPLKSMMKIQFSDKLAHALAYGGLAILMRWVIYVWRRTSLKQYALIVFICAIYATLDEQLQRFVPSRSCDLNDWIADMIGVGVFTSLGFQIDNSASGFSLLLLWGIGGVRSAISLPAVRPIGRTSVTSLKCIPRASR